MGCKNKNCKKCLESKNDSNSQVRDHHDCGTCSSNINCAPPYNGFGPEQCPDLPPYQLPQPIGYPNCEPCPYYLDGPSEDIHANGLKGIAARNRQAVLRNFHDYITYYERDWTPVNVNDKTCNPYGPYPQGPFDKEHIDSQEACRTAMCRKHEDAPSAYKQKKYPRAYIAINAVKLQKPPGGEEGIKAFFRMMRIISSHMCMATAGHPGFLGYDIIRQTGNCPAMLRWAVDADMLDEMSDFWMDQYTVWRSYEDHEDFHELFEDVVMMACMHCGMVMTEGPYEYTYAVLDRYLPRVVSNSTYNRYLTNPDRNSDDPAKRKKAELLVDGYAVDTGNITNVQMFFDVIPGHEDIFETYINQVFQNLTNTGHCLGYLVARNVGMNTSGIAAYKIKSMYWEFMDSSGVRQLEENATLAETFPVNPRYLIRSDWTDVEAIKMYLSQVHTDRRNLFPFSLGVLDRAISRPDVRVSVPHKSDYRWLEYLNNTMTPKYDYTCDYLANLAFAPDLCENKWFYFFGFERDPCTGARLRDDGGHLIPAAPDHILPLLPGRDPNDPQNPNAFGPNPCP